MTWKKLYEQNKNRKTEIIDKIEGDFAITTSIKYVIKQYPYPILISSVVTFLALILAFHKTPKAMLYSFLLIVFLLLCAVFFNSFSIIGKQKKITIKTNGQEIIIPYHQVKSIYLEETSFRILFKKHHQYSLILLYETPKHTICDIILSTNLLPEKQIESFLGQIKVKSSSTNYQEKCIYHKKRRFLKKAILFLVLSLIVFFLSLFRLN